jgi:hypothetical protein
MIGVVLLVLGVTGWIGRLARDPAMRECRAQLGLGLLMSVLGFADHAAALFALIPIGAVCSPLIFAGTDLAISRRRFYRKPSCLWVIGTTPRLR